VTAGHRVRAQPAVTARGRGARGVAAASLVALLLVSLPGDATAQRGRGREATSSAIQVVVDGEVRRVWTSAELMRWRLDAPNVRGKFRPMVALTEALPFEALGVVQDRVVEVSIQGQGRKLRLTGEALAHLGDLLLQVDIDKGAVWKLVPRTREAEAALTRLVGVGRIVVQDVRRIELTTGPVSGPRS